MKSAYSTLMQSKFFNPAFNSAIFDGPVRIYFSQIHESLALKIYFSLQQKAQDTLSHAKEIQKQSGKNLLVMLYPNHDAFHMSFEEQPEGDNQFLAFDHLEDDSIIGINGPFEDHQLENVVAAVQKSIQGWTHEGETQSIHA